MDSHTDDGLVASGRVVRLDHIGGDLQGQVCLLQVLIADHRADFVLDDLSSARQLAWVPPGKCLQTLECVQVERSLLLFQKIKEGLEEVLRGGDGNHRCRIGLLLRVGSDHSQPLQGSFSRQFVLHPIGKDAEVGVENLLS